MADDIKDKTNLIINFLPPSFRTEDLFGLFSSLGRVASCKVIKDLETGKSLCYGFVQYSLPAEAQDAIKHLNGFQIEDKYIKVALARPGTSGCKEANLYIQNVPQDFDDKLLEASFLRFGPIVHTKVLIYPSTGISKGAGFVQFEKKEDAERAMKEMNGRIPAGGIRPLDIKIADDNSKKKKPVSNGSLDVHNMGNANASVSPMRAPMASSKPLGHGCGLETRQNYGHIRSLMDIDQALEPDPYIGPMRKFAHIPGRGGTAMRYSPMTSGVLSRETAPPIQKAGFNTANQEVTLFVYNIGDDAIERDLWALFSPFGPLKKADVIMDREQNKCKGYGFVTMTCMDHALKAIQALNGRFYRNTHLQVSIKKNK